MALSEHDLVDAAVDVGLLDRDDLERVQREARRARLSLSEAVARHVRTPRAALWRAVAETRGLPFLGPGDLVPTPSDLDRLPAGYISRRQVLPIRDGRGRLLAAVANPDDMGALDQLARALGEEPSLALAHPEALAGAVGRAMGEASAESLDRESAASLLEEIFSDAYLARASDVHICPVANHAEVRLRIDGRLQDWRRDLIRGERDAVINRVKVLADMDIAESRAPQDGSFEHRLDDFDAAIEIRVSSLPVKWGERVTMRLLGMQEEGIGLDQLGMPALARDALRERVRRPHGMILVTGPTGSGKSTTLYSVLREIDRRRLNVMTVEDPIEQIVDGAAQVQVTPKVGFAGALRSILRQDPDVILIGEIRDGETADIALKAAQTGHLVFSTLHTNNAVGAVTRLTDLGVGAYQIGASLLGVIAQRLTRRLCRRCAEARPATPEEAALLGVSEGPPPLLKEPRGCAHCLGSGYVGRVGAFETLWLGDAAAEAIAGRAGERAVMREADGFSPIAEDLRAKVLDGTTALSDAIALGLRPGR
ncbi:MAG: ATPase, T2SS/T4P/T4SS family [Pseudomonadota bacterium]